MKNFFGNRPRRGVEPNPDRSDTSRTPRGSQINLSRRGALSMSGEGKSDTQMRAGSSSSLPTPDAASTPGFIDPLVLGPDGKPESVMQPLALSQQLEKISLDPENPRPSPASSPKHFIPPTMVMEGKITEMVGHPAVAPKSDTSRKAKGGQYRGEPCHCNKLMASIEKIEKDIKDIQAAIGRIESRYASIPAAPPRVYAQSTPRSTGTFRQFDIPM